MAVPSRMSETKRETKLREALEEVRNLAKGIAETVTQPLLVLDPHRTIIRANRAFYRQFLFEKSQVVGKQLYELGPDWDIPELHRLVDEVLPERSAFRNIELRSHFEGRGERTLRVSGRLVLGDDDEGFRVLLVFDDLTELEEARAVQERSVLRLRRVLVIEDDEDLAEVLLDAFADQAPQVDVEVVPDSDAARQILDARHVDVVIGPVAPVVQLLKSDDGSPVLPVLVTASDPDDMGIAEAIGQGALDYVQRSPATYAAMPHIVQGALREWRQILRLRDAEDQLRHADRLMTVGKLAAGVVHEIATPLNIIRLQAQMTSDQDIVEQCDRISSIVRETLAFARARTGSAQRTNLTELVARTLVLLAPTAHQAQVQVKFDPPGAVWAVVDGGQLRQVLFNLCINALQALGGRPGTVEVRIEQDADGVSIAVRDNGEGMAPAQLSRVFEPFYTTKESELGTGLGLSVSRGIIEDHGGDITVDSVQGEGSTFTIRLPSGV